jgi:hypothetical protein
VSAHAHRSISLALTALGGFTAFMGLKPSWIKCGDCVISSFVVQIGFISDIERKMIRRFDAGTDVAAIGAWDVTRTEPIRKFSDLLLSLDADASAGHLFLINTGSDGGYLLEVRLDESAPDPVQYVAARREVLLRVPSGRLKVGGVEDYLSDHPPQITSELDVMEVSPGDYGVRLYLEREPDLERRHPDDVTDEELRQVVSEDDLRFTNRRHRAGCVLMLLGLAAAVAVGWRVGGSAGLFVALGTVFGVGGTLMKRFDTDPRVMRVEEARRAISLQKFAALPADFTLMLRLLREGEVLTGGAIQLEQEEKAIRCS